MVRFIDDQKVPTRALCLLRSPFASGVKSDGGQYELIVEKRVVGGPRSFDGCATLLVEDVKPEVEAAQQFHEPLMNKRFGDQNQHALHPAGENQTVKDQARLDCLAESYFICKKDARREAAGNFG